MGYQESMILTKKLAIAYKLQVTVVYAPWWPEVQDIMHTDTYFVKLRKLLVAACRYLGQEYIQRKRGGSLLQIKVDDLSRLKSESTLAL